MKKGDTVKIYKDPITCKKLEGFAKLVKLINDNTLGGLVEFWDVKFIDDGFKCARFVNRDTH